MQLRGVGAAPSGSGDHARAASTKRAAGASLGEVHRADVAGQREHRDAAVLQRAPGPRARAATGICSGLVTVWQNTATSLNSASLSTSWKKSLPTSASGTWPQSASTGACDFLAS